MVTSSIIHASPLFSSTVTHKIVTTMTTAPGFHVNRGEAVGRSPHTGRMAHEALRRRRAKYVPIDKSDMVYGLGTEPNE